MSKFLSSYGGGGLSIEDLQNGSQQLNVNKITAVNMYANKYVVPSFVGPQAGYLMSDGSISVTSQQGQPNIYLYNNNNSSTAPVPAAGTIRTNNLDNQLTTMLYISHLTSDNIDIDVFLSQITTITIIYMQDKNNSANYVRFQVTGPTTNVPNSYFTVPVVYQIGSGTGVTDLGSGAAIFMSLFDNSALVDTRLSAVETKVNDLEGIVDAVTEDVLTLELDTQAITYVDSITRIMGNVNILLNPLDFFAIRSETLSENYLILTPEQINIYKKINMNANLIENLSGIKIGSGNDNYFVKSNGAVDSNQYALSSDVTTIQNDIITLEGKTQNQSATSLSTTFNKSILLTLDTTLSESVQIRDTGLNLLYQMNDTALRIFRPLQANNNNLTGVNNLACVTINSSGDITGNKFIVPLASSGAFLKGDGSLDISVYLKQNGSVAMTGDLNMGTHNISNAGTISGTSMTVSGDATANGFKTPTGTGSYLLDDGNIDSNYYMPADAAYDATSVAYVDSGGLLNSNVSNRYCQSGTNLQLIVDTVTSSADQHIELSAGIHTVNLTLTKIAYSISGVITPPQQPTTTINGNVTIGGVVNTSLIKISNVIITGTTTFFSSATAQQLKHSFNNVQFSNTLTFPTAVLGTSGYIYFTDCVISTANAIVFNNITATIIFTRCRFNNNVITNNAPTGSIIFDTCTGLNAYLSNAIYRGVNVLNNNTSQLGSTTKYCNIQALGVSPVTNTGTGEIILNQVATIGSFTYADAQIGTCREWVFHGTTTRSSNTSSTYTLRHKTGGVENMLLTMPASPNATVSNLAFVLRFRVVRYTAAAVSWSGQWTDAERTWSFYTTQNNTGGIPALNVNGAFTITFQASNANTSILIHHVDVNNIYA